VLSRLTKINSSILYYWYICIYNLKVFVKNNIIFLNLKVVYSWKYIYSITDNLVLNSFIVIIHKLHHLHNNNNKTNKFPVLHVTNVTISLISGTNSGRSNNSRPYYFVLVDHVQRPSPNVHYKIISMLNTL